MAKRSKYRPRKDDERMSAPRPYNLDDPAELHRLHAELCGYMRVSLQDGTDTEGRAHAYAALCELVRRDRQVQMARAQDGLAARNRAEMEDRVGGLYPEPPNAP